MLFFCSFKSVDQPWILKSGTLMPCDNISIMLIKVHNFTHLYVCIDRYISMYAHRGRSAFVLNTFNDVLSHFTVPIIWMSLPSTVVSPLTSTTSQSGPVGLIRSHLEPVGVVLVSLAPNPQKCLFCLHSSLLYDIFLSFAVMSSTPRFIHTHSRRKAGASNVDWKTPRIPPFILELID